MLERTQGLGHKDLDLLARRLSAGTPGQVPSLQDKQRNLSEQVSLFHGKDGSDQDPSPCRPWTALLCGTTQHDEGVVELSCVFKRVPSTGTAGDAQPE